MGQSDGARFSDAVARAPSNLVKGASVMGHVFISYHGEDGDFVADLIRQLEGAGIRAWSENERLRNGEGWREAIDQAIRDAFALIVVFSPTARASEQIQYE